MDISEWLDMRIGLLSHPQFYQKPLQATYRRLVWSVYAKHQAKLKFQTEYGFQIAGSPKDIGLGSLFYRGQYEWGELKLWQQALNQNNLIIFDIGANFGLYSLVTAAHCRKYHLKKTRIFGFEPNPIEYEKFTNNVRLNEYTEISVYQLALSDFEGTCKMNALSDGLGVFSHLVESEDIININNDDVVYVKTTDLDTWCKTNSIDKIDLMKIDVEGHELRVLKGAKKMLACQAIDFLMMEVGHGQWKDALDLLNSYNYSINLICRDGSLVPFQEENLKGWDNIVAHPIDKSL